MAQVVDIHKLKGEDEILNSIRDYFVKMEDNIIESYLRKYSVPKIKGRITAGKLKWRGIALVETNKEFVRTKYHYSNLYWGSSLLSLCDLAQEKGYSFIGCNSNGNNAYFIRNDKRKELKILTAHQGFVMSKFRESRNKQGGLTYLSGHQRLEAIRGMDIYNTRTRALEKI